MKTNYDKEYILESKKIYKEADDQLRKEYRYRQIKKRSNTYYIENKEKVKDIIKKINRCLKNIINNIMK